MIYCSGIICAGLFMFFPQRKALQVYRWPLTAYICKLTYLLPSTSPATQQVTLVSSYVIKSHPNLTQITVDMSFEKLFNDSFKVNDPSTASHVYTSLLPTVCTDALSRDDEQQINVDQFHLVMTGYRSTECFLSLLHGKTVPRILLIPNNISGALHRIIGNVDFPSFVPTLDSGQFYPMGFGSRLLNTVQNVRSILWTDWITRPKMLLECKARGLCPQNMASLMDIEKQSSLLFINNVRALDEPARPFMPGVINVGGLNCRSVEQLPEDLEEWLSGSGENGSIYISLGTAVSPSDIPERSRHILVEVFKSLPYRVVWKWDEETMLDLPPNVKLAKWLPQQDILGHPNLKLFISHGGLFSTLEATYHGVPVLGMPVFGDQYTNVGKMVAEGWGEREHWIDLNVDSFRIKILKLITDKRYLEIVQRRSRLMRDQLVSPREEVAYWTEYVIRHKGAPHLRSPLHDLYWHEVYNVDVWLLICFVLVGTALLLVMLFTALLRWCCRQGGRAILQLRVKRRHGKDFSFGDYFKSNIKMH